MANGATCTINAETALHLFKAIRALGIRETPDGFMCDSCGCLVKPTDSADGPPSAAPTFTHFLCTMIGQGLCG